MQSVGNLSASEEPESLAAGGGAEKRRRFGSSKEKQEEDGGDDGPLLFCLFICLTMNFKLCEIFTAC